MNNLKALVRSALPPAVLTARRARSLDRTERSYRGKTSEQIFSEIYAAGSWGGGGDFCSGSGSHDAGVVEPYVAAVKAFVAALPQAPTAVDLGCGDFNVGRQVRDDCAAYIACDVVPGLVERNRRDFGGDFRRIDIAADALPVADIAFIRQVLQHLRNEQVARVVPKLYAYRHLVITEHVPAGRFTANLDKPSGKGIRLGLPSGIVLTEAPFDLRPESARVLCEAPESGGIIRTILYTMPA